MLFCYSYAAKVCAKNKSLCYCYVITVLTKNPIIIKPILQDLYISLYTMKKIPDIKYLFVHNQGFYV